MPEVCFLKKLMFFIHFAILRVQALSTRGCSAGLKVGVMALGFKVWVCGPRVLNCRKTKGFSTFYDP